MWIVVFCIAPIIFTSAFVIRDPDLNGEALLSDDNTLSDALRVLQREKRRLDDEATFRDWGPGYYDNWDDNDLEKAIEEEEDGYGLGNNPDVSNDIANYLTTLVNEEAKVPFDREPGLEEEKFQDADEFNDLPYFNSQKLSIDELKDLFNGDGNDNQKSKKLAARKKKTPEVEDSLLGDRERLTQNLKAEKQKSKSKKRFSSIDLENLSKPQIKELLDEVDKIEKEEVISRQNGKDVAKEVIEISRGEEDDEEEEEPDLEPVTEEELEDVFSENPNDNDNVTDLVDEDEVDDTDEDFQDAADDDDGTGRETNEWLLGDDLDGRSKRMAKRGSQMTGNGGANSFAVISRLLDIIGKLRLQSLLENKEIDNLADALDLATSSKTQNSLKQLPKVLQSLQGAIKIEESLQGGTSELTDQDKEFLHGVIEGLVANGDAEDEMDDGDLNEKNKRGDGFYEDEETDGGSKDGKWYEGPIRNQIDDPDDADNEDENEMLQDLLDRNTAEEILADIANEEDSETGLGNDGEAEEYAIDDIAEDDDEDERSPSAPYPDALARLFRDEAVDEETQREIEQALAQFSHNVEPWQRRELETRIRDYEQCTALDSLVTDCRMADDLNIPLDDEARELCSRHEACYACGGDLGKAVGQCDAGYLAEALQLCNGVDQCNVKADAFLRLLQYYHRYSANPNDSCEHQCVVDYIYGVTV